MSHSDLQFKFDDIEGKLYAVYYVAAGESASLVNKQMLLKKLKDDGYGKLHCLEKGIDHVVSSFTQPKTGEGKVCIAEKRDAEVSLHISKDKMAAYLTIHKPEGGKPATLDMVKHELAEKGIRSGFLPKAIKAAIITGEADEVLIAKGEPIINGEDAKFTCLIKNMKIRTPKISEDGHVDYRDLGEIQVVHPGEKLMRRDPATQGQSSKNIFGAIVNPKAGKDTKFAAGLEGVTVSPQNPNILIATVTGQPIICNNGVNVEKTMTIATVDLKSGNVIFDGSIIVEGDVTSGMKVKASGDVKIHGMVENANIEAGGNINVKGAVIGRSDNNTPATEDLVKMDAKGSVSAKFVENATIASGDKIMIQDWVIKSSLVAVNEIIVGKKDAKKGQIVGGSVTSGILVKAMNIGSNAGATTHIQVGNANDIEDQKMKIGIQISHIMKEIYELQKTFKELKNNPTNQAKDTLKRAIISKQDLEKDLLELRAVEADLDREKKRAKNAKVIVGKMVYAGTSINISKYNEDLQSDVGGRTFSIKDNKISQSAK